MELKFDEISLSFDNDNDISLNFNSLRLVL